MQPTGFDSDIFQEIVKDSEPPSGEEIAGNIMAFARVSAGNPDPVHSATESLENIVGFHAPGTGNTDNTDIGRIRHPAHSGQICSPIGTPVT